MLRVLLLGMLLSLAWGCKGGGRSKKELCETMYTKRQALPVFQDEGGTRRALYLSECATLPHKYLKCDAGGYMDRSCAALLARYQGDLDEVLIKGVSMARVREERARKKREREEMLKKIKKSK